LELNLLLKVLDGAGKLLFFVGLLGQRLDLLVVGDPRVVAPVVEALLLLV
jgi:hypothetical protein